MASPSVITCTAVRMSCARRSGVCGCRTERWARRAAHRSRALRTACPETRSGMGAAHSSPRRESDRAQAEMPTKSGDCWMRRHRTVLQIGTCERAALWHAWLSATGVYRNNTLLHTQVKGVPPHSKATHAPERFDGKQPVISPAAWEL